MNKKDLTATVAFSSGISKSEAAKRVDIVLDVIAKALASGNDVRIARFGRFWVGRSANRTGRNPATGDAIFIPAANRLKFRAALALRNAVMAGPRGTGKGPPEGGRSGGGGGGGRSRLTDPIPGPHGGGTDPPEGGFDDELI